VEASCRNGNKQSCVPLPCGHLSPRSSRMMMAPDPGRPWSKWIVPDGVSQLVRSRRDSDIRREDLVGSATVSRGDIDHGYRQSGKIGRLGRSGTKGRKAVDDGAFRRCGQDASGRPAVRPVSGSERGAGIAILVLARSMRRRLAGASKMPAAPDRRCRPTSGCMGFRGRSRQSS
jgi:hypothetical protein